ncbi:SURF1-like protein [Agromyces rhizosphaerae]|uniref:SURF1-like protein n=1 Tax=Agromyces rhizosphaerae TaxID=88374 RepID=A0A9W6FQU3_9MICO|nr:SURF1 family protein [Agromyces rhizosphaerae]GLI28890.1 SURF1-like protein [Agromyces rhizosphaerae]
MSDWRFLLSRRWAGYLALTVVFAIVCALLGTWQLNRRAEALTEVSRIDANYDADPVPITEALPAIDGFDEDLKWLPVAVSGEWMPEAEVLVRNRPYSGATGYEVITPFRLDDGTVFMIDRGWISAPVGGGEVDVPGVPDGRVEVAARLKAGEDVIAGRSSSGDLLATIDLDELADRVDAPSYTGAYGLLVQSGAEANEPPLPATRPVRDEGPHLSYAFQWFVFALMAFVGLGWAARQERKSLAFDDDDAAEAPEPQPRPRRRGPSDAEVEDGILDGTH